MFLLATRLFLPRKGSKWYNYTMFSFANKLWAKLLFILVAIFLVLPIFKLATEGRVVVINNPLLEGQTASLTREVEPADKSIINAIFLGTPGEGNNAPDLTDTLMVLSFNPNTNKGLLVSIPRDLLVNLPGTNSYIKINALYQKTNIKTVQEVLSEITGLDFDYRVAVNLDGVKELIDQIDGIDVFIAQDIYDPNFPGVNNSYELFSLKKGLQHLDGQTALKYIRTRHSPRGDFDRMAHQQQVLVALKEKMADLHPLWDLPIILDLWQTLNRNLESNLSIFNIKNFWNIFREINLEEINFKILDTTTDLVFADNVLLGNGQAYVLKPKAGLNNYSEIQNYIKNLVSQN